MKPIMTGCAIALLATALIAGCGQKHEDFPDPLGLTASPPVATVTVTSASNPPPYDYDVEWTIPDTSDVQFFRVYSSFDGMNFALVQDTIPPTQTTGQYTAAFPVVAFGVSTVSYDNVEAAMVTAEAP